MKRYINATGSDSSGMTVSKLIEELKQYDPNSRVFGIDWSTGVTYDISVGKDDNDVLDNVYIELYEI